jgi:hypothetical protein
VRADLSSEEKKALRRKYNASWLAKNPKAYRNKHYKKRYGITIEQYEEMHDKQNGLCAICKRPETRVKVDGTTRVLSVDHCHKTGQVRDLLCGACNLVLGHIEKYNIPMENVITYLQKWPELPND